MSIQPPQGILNIPNATLRVGKLEVNSTEGLDTVLNNIERNTILLEDTTEYPTTGDPVETEKRWGLKVPNIFVATFEIKGTGSSFNFRNTSNGDATKGYTLEFSGTTLTLKYNNASLTTATIPDLDAAYGKVYLTYEKQYFTVTVDGTLVLTYKDTTTRTPPEGEYANFFKGTGSSGFKNLKVVAGHFISDGTSNVSLFGGLAVTSNLEVGSSNLFVDTQTSRVGVGTSTPGATLDVSGNVYVSSNLEVGTANLFVDTVNSRVGLGTTTPLRTLDIVGDIGVTANTSIFVGSNVVAEYTGPHDRPLRKYPEVLSPGTGLAPVSVTTPFTGLTQSWNGYEITMSSRWNTSGDFNGDHAFDDNESSNWTSGNSPATYDSNGDATSEDTLNGVDGSYLIMKLPKAIKPSYANIKTRDANSFAPRHPKTGKFYGSNDGSSWTEIGTFSYGSIPSSIYYQKFNLVGTNTYQYIAIQVHTVFNDSGPSGGTTNGVVIIDLQYYGHEEGSGSIDTTLKSVYNVPATTGTQLEVYYDAKDLADGAVTSVADLSPNSNGGSVTGDPQVSNGAFVFDGVGDYISGTLPSSVTGEWVHSTSMWFKTSNYANENMIFIGNVEAGNGRIAVAISSTGEFTIGISGSNVKYASAFPLDFGWHHLTYTYAGGVAGTGATGYKLYVDGVNITQTGGVGSGTLNLPTGPNFFLGSGLNGGAAFNGSIANFRLYSKVLNAGQVQELYDYQKDYFFGTHSSVTLHKGRFGVGTKEPIKELDVVGDVGISANLHMTTQSSILVDSNVVAEYTGPHDRPLRKYPEVAMTANDNSSTSGYSVVQSTQSTNSTETRKAWSLFNHVTSGGGGNTYHGDDGVTTNSISSPYTNADGTYQENPAESLGGVNGTWLYIRLPKKISLDHVRLTSRYGTAQRTPRSGTFLGSNDAVNWSILSSFSDITLVDPAGTSSPEHTYTYNVNSTVKYEYFGFVWEKIGTNYYVNIEELELYGYEEGSGSLDTTLKSVYNVPATTGTQLEVYYDGQDYSADTDFDQANEVLDKSGNNLHGSQTGDVGFDSTYKAFTFDGSGDSISRVITNSQGAYVHSWSTWVKLDTLSGQILWHLGQDGTGGGSDTSSIYIQSDGRLDWFWWSNDVRFNNQKLITGTWYHLAGSYNGGAPISSRKLWINGIEQVISSTSGSQLGTALSLEANTTLRLGTRYAGGNFLDGSIANFRLYSKALNAEQIKELYDYQKDYFLGSKSQVTLYKGHLGVGVTEPSGQLELAGDERIQEYPPGPMSDYETLIPGHGVFCVSASSYYSSSLKPFNAFNKITTSGTSPWISSGNPDTFDELTGLASSADSFEGTNGPWIKLELPYNVKPKKVQMFMRTTIESSSARKPKSGIVYGRKDGMYHQITNFDFGSTDKDIPLEELNLNTHEYYSEFVLQITSMYLTGISQDAIAIKGINYFGTPGPTTLDKGSLSLTRSLDVPRISRYDVDTETPRPEKLVVDFDTTVNSSPTDISGKGNHGVFYNGAKYSPVDKAFSFDGTDDSIRGIINNPDGDWVHSISFWFKLGIDQSTISGRIDPFTIGRQGTGGVNRTTDLPSDDIIGHYSACDITPTVINWYFYGNDATFSISGIKANEWHHLTFAYEGGGAVASRHAFFDGVEYPNVGTSTAELQMFANSILALGVDFGRVSSSPSYFNGQLSNFKIYNAYLEPSEVKKLYNLGRTGRSMVISDTAVGIGKVPEAQLDVRGILKASVGLFQDKPHFACEVYRYGLKDNDTTQTLYWHGGDTATLSSAGTMAGCRWKLGSVTGNHTYKTNNVQLVSVLNDSSSETSGVKVPYDGYYHLTHQNRTISINTGTSFVIYSPRHNKYIQTSINGYRVPWGGNTWGGTGVDSNSIHTSLYLEAGDVVIYIFHNAAIADDFLSGSYEQFVSLVML